MTNYGFLSDDLKALIQDLTPKIKSGCVKVCRVFYDGLNDKNFLCVLFWDLKGIFSLNCFKYGKKSVFRRSMSSYDNVSLKFKQQNYIL